MVLKLYGHDTSPSTRFVGLILHEKKVPYEFVSVDFTKGEHKSPANLARQPFGQLPHIDDDGFILYESHAIARYIATKYANQGTKLIPTNDPKQYALFEQATFSQISNFDSPAFGIVFELLVKKAQGQGYDQAKVDTLKSTLSSKMDVYEQILAKQKYLAGNEITVADCACVYMATILARVDVDITQGRPHVARWLNELRDRESWQALQTKGLASTA